MRASIVPSVKRPAARHQVRALLRLPVLAALGALVLTGCGSEEKKPTEVLELEETLGFSPEGIMERQSRVENRIRDCMKVQGFDYTPVDPFARQQALTPEAQPLEIRVGTRSTPARP